MKKIALLLLSVLFSLTINCQEKTKETIKPTITQQRPSYLVGIKTKEDFKQAPYLSWYKRNHDNYKLDDTTVKALKKHIKGVKIKAFMGTWCGDSRREIPHFYKILEAIGFNEKNLEMICVNTGKKTPDNLQEGLDIKRVPTFIFYKKGKEIGRYVEYARESLEKDMLAILSGKDYKHVYSDPNKKSSKKH